MKRFFSISFVCAAVVAVLSIPVVPHHHHDSLACAVSHGCENPNGCANADERHEHETGETGNPGNCIAETEFTGRIERNDKDGDCGSAACGHDGHPPLFPIVYLCASLCMDQPEVETDYGEYIVHDHAVHVRTGGGRRAPPAILC